MNLLRDPLKIKLGSFIEERNRFNKSNFTIYKVVYLDRTTDFMRLEVVVSSRSAKSGTYSAMISAHCMSGPSAWLSYLLDCSDTSVILYSND
jgi:hypothetical protein